MIIRIGKLLEAPLTDYDQPPLFSWKQFYDFRNNVLRVLRRFGTAGPMGEVDIAVDDDDDGLAFEPGIIDSPDFFVVDDMYNEHDRLSHVECDPIHISAELLTALSELDQHFPDWWTVFSLGDSGLRVSGDSLLCGGRRFWDCTSVQQVAERCTKPVDFGEAISPADSMYPLWLGIVSGQCTNLANFASGPDRQWNEILLVLENELGRRRGRPLNSFHYDAVRNDLHPETRRVFVLRVLSEFGSLPPEQVKQALRNIQRDAGFALVNCTDAEQREASIKALSDAQNAIVGRVSATDVVLWWANILDRAGAPSGELNRQLIEALWHRLASVNEWIPLSATFALARLGVPNSGLLINDLKRTNPHWSSNLVLTKWLDRLAAGSRSYPSGLEL